MALGSWTAIYTDVITELMEERREQELLLLLAIQKHGDPFGFCWPSRKSLMRLRHCSQALYERRLAWLQERFYVAVIESYDYRRRQKMFDMQISPRVLYVRPEFQAYCELVFDGEKDRDYALEKSLLGNLLRTNDSQPEVVPESETRIREPDSGTSTKTRRHNQLSTAPKQKSKPQGSTMRNGAKPEKQAKPPEREAHRKTDPQAVPRVDFQELLSPAVDDDRMAKEIELGVGTTPHQARAAVDTYPRDGLVYWLEMTARRRHNGTVTKPGAWFFTMLRKHVPPLDQFDLP